MAQILVRNRGEDIVARLKEQAREQGRSLQVEAKRILEEAAGRPMLTAARFREECQRIQRSIRRRLKGRSLPDSVEVIREMREGR